LTRPAAGVVYDKADQLRARIVNPECPPFIYLRVSTAEQETDSQEHQVLEYCRVRGWLSPQIFRDSASGATSTRPGLDDMLAQVRAGGVHQVVTYKLDRLGRSLTHLAIIVGELQLRNVALICTSQGIDTRSRILSAGFNSACSWRSPSSSGRLSKKGRWPDWRSRVGAARDWDGLHWMRRSCG
jgi:hypothetical protein